MESKIPEYQISSLIRVYHLYKSVPLTEKRLGRPETGIKDRFEKMKLKLSFETFRPEKQELPFQMFRSSQTFFVGTAEKLVFHLDTLNTAQLIVLRGN